VEREVESSRVAPVEPGSCVERGDGVRVVVTVESESERAGAVPSYDIVELDGGRAVPAHIYDGQVAYTAAIRVVVRVDQ
jgi:hypothetical protein